MKLTWHVVMIIFVTVTFGSASGWSEGPPSTTDCEDLKTLNASIQELASVMRQSAAQDKKYQELELAVAYLQFRSRRIEILEQELRRAEERKASSEGQLERINEELARYERNLPNISEEEALRTREAVEQVDRMVAFEEAKIDRLELEIIDLQNEIAEGKLQTIYLEDYLLENLDVGD
mgnify:CR=1 FL=1